VPPLYSGWWGAFSSLADGTAGLVVADACVASRWSFTCLTSCAGPVTALGRLRKDVLSLKRRKF